MRLSSNMPYAVALPCEPYITRAFSIPSMGSSTTSMPYDSHLSFTSPTSILPDSIMASMYLLEPMVPAMMGFLPSGIALYCISVFLLTAFTSDTKQANAVDTTSSSSGSYNITHLSRVSLPVMVKHPSSGVVTMRMGTALVSMAKAVSMAAVSSLLSMIIVVLVKISVMYTCIWLQKYAIPAKQPNIPCRKKHESPISAQWQKWGLAILGYGDVLWIRNRQHRLPLAIQLLPRIPHRWQTPTRSGC